MPQGSTVRLAVAIAFGITAITGGAHAADGSPAPQEATVADDPYQWLEDVTGDKSIAWVREQNAKSGAELAQSAPFRKLEGDIRAILDSDAKIPVVEKIGDHYYNFWKDKSHERGLWRRTTLDEYRKPQPRWETVIDLDALNAAEKENWVWHGSTFSVCLTWFLILSALGGDLHCKVLDPIVTTGMTVENAGELADKTQALMQRELDLLVERHYKKKRV